MLFYSVKIECKKIICLILSSLVEEMLIQSNYDFE